jgi:Lon-like protease
MFVPREAWWRRHFAALIAAIFSVRMLYLVGIAVAVIGVLFFIPLPFYIFGPGAAVDLNGLMSVPGHSPPPGHLYLTDVTVMPGRPIFYAAAKTLPGYEIVPRSYVAPPDKSESQVNREWVDAMKESQIVAQVVAERAAGLVVGAHEDITINSTVKNLPAGRCFRPGDRIISVEGKEPSDAGFVGQMTAKRPVGSAFHLAILRKGARLAVTCRTAMYKGKPRFGMTVIPVTRAYSLPVHVDFHVKDINGSSAGLMFALQIYRSLTGLLFAGGAKIAGTGVLQADGSVTPIGGVREKVTAAQHAGAAVFLVPEHDYPDIKNVSGIRIIPVRSFKDALAKLRALQM